IARIEPAFGATSTVFAPASSSARRGSVSSDCSTPSVAMIATRMPSSARSFMTTPPLPPPQSRCRAAYDACVDGMPSRIQLVEVAPRDGLQVEARTLDTPTKLALLDRLATAGHTIIETTSFVSPKAVPQLADAEELLRSLKRRAGVRYPVLVPNERGLERALSVGVDEIAVFASASESYSHKNLNRSRADAFAGYTP